MFAAKWHEHAELSPRTERSHYRALLVVVHIRERHCHTGQCSLGEVLFQHALRTVSRSSMRHFVTKNGRKGSFVLRDWQNARVDYDLAAWQTECVYLRGPNQRDLPIKVRTCFACCPS